MMARLMQLGLFLLVAAFSAAEAGKIFVWLPAVSKSITISYAPLFEALAKRGHEITVVHPFQVFKGTKGITEIQSIDFMDSFLDELSG